MNPGDLPWVQDYVDIDDVVESLQGLDMGPQNTIYQAVEGWDQLRTNIKFAHESPIGKVPSEIKGFLADHPEYPAWSGQKDALIKNLQHNAPPQKFFILGIPPSEHKDYSKISERQRCFAHFIVSEILSKLHYDKNASSNVDDQSAQADDQSVQADDQSVQADDQSVQIFIERFVTDPCDIPGNEKDSPLIKQTQNDFEVFSELFEPNHGEEPPPDLKFYISCFSEFESKIADRNSFVIVFNPENPFRSHIAKLCQDADEYPGTIICTPSDISNKPSSSLPKSFVGGPAGSEVEKFLDKYEARLLLPGDVQSKDGDKPFPEICIHSRKNFIEKMPPVKQSVPQSEATKKT